ncbi:MAG TPA: HIT family protein [Acholeplasmataceae bacterium]|jgi:histidine triad (HIT) family protein|nr:HIT family protein [Acholeplasmataceae bacterium]
MCVFCKIVQGEIPAYKVYEDDDILAFLDISQATPGHTLVIPKEHCENIFALEENKAANLMKVVTRLSKKLKVALNIDALNILNNSGQLAGQTVNHFHIHLLPRSENDGLIIKFSSNKLSETELKGLQKKLKEG